MHVRDFADFDTLRTAHPEFAAQPPTPELFRSLDWFELLVRHGMPADAVPYLLSMSAAAGQPCCLPLLRQPHGITSLSNYYSGLFGPVGEGTPAAWLMACRHLRASRPRPASITLQPLDGDGAFFSEMRRALGAAGYWVDGYFCFGNWYLPTAGLNFADYFAARPSAVRNTIRRGRHKLDGAGNWQVTVHTAPGAALDAAVESYEAIYRQSWKPAEAHPNFIRALCALAARKGWLRLGVLSLEGRAIASQIWLFCGGKACIFKLAYDPEATRYSPGSVLTAAMMEHAMDRDGAHEIDYLSGDDAYKRDWMSHRRERHGLIAFDPTTWRGLLAGLRHFGARAVKTLLPRKTP